MGYSADLIQGSPITITKCRSVIAALKEAEKTENSVGGSHGHISWCHEVQTYLDNALVTTPEDEDTAYATALKELLYDYGFDQIEITDQGLIINSWGGDKLGSSWGTVWGCLAQGYEGEPVFWIMQGEDGQFWCQALRDGNCEELPVEINFEVAL